MPDKFVFLDTETTGLNPMTDRVVEFGAIIVDGESRIERSQLINPEMPIPSVVSRIHNITDAMVRGKRTFAEVQPNLEKEIPAGSVLVAHNASFDLQMLYAECLRIEKEDWLLSMTVVDTYKASKALRPRSRHSLDALCGYLGVNVDSGGSRHRAIHDTRMLESAYHAWVTKIGTLLLPDELKPKPAEEYINVLRFVGSSLSPKTYVHEKPKIIHPVRPRPAIRQEDKDAHQRMMARIAEECEDDDGPVWGQYS